ncbi:hypothetical protein C5167_044214 [Papaver somniferum]|uniref:Transport inhibitor response 1 domain-containing protein n=1 Tax=Papaver somniferum TaxID=3469 RepID=A0A4Y7LAU8_PAPSO|nr:hypothetical protein C5167_044214 [Papaver somniferum]
MDSSRVKALTLKGKPHFSDFNLVRHDWGGFVSPWIEAMAKSYLGLEEIRLKRMVVFDHILELLSHSFPNFKSIVLVSCEGFTADGLAAIAANCRENACSTELGMVALSMGCPMLNSLLYVCQQMTNASLVAVPENCPNIVRFRLCILEPKKPDHVTLEPLDEGFGEIVQSFKGLTLFSLSGLLTDMAFMYIGKYGEQLDMLSVAFVGESDMGMLYVLNGCKKLKKLEIRDSPFGNTTLLTNMGKYEAM